MKLVHLEKLSHLKQNYLFYKKSIYLTNIKCARYISHEKVAIKNGQIELGFLDVAFDGEWKCQVYCRSAPCVWYSLNFQNLGKHLH